MARWAVLRYYLRLVSGSYVIANAVVIAMRGHHVYSWESYINDVAIMTLLISVGMRICCGSPKHQ